MKSRIELAATAKADLREQALWRRDQASPATADQWLAGLYKAIDTLETRPLRCPVAAENDKCFFEFVQNVRKRGKALLGALIALLVTPGP